MTYKLDSISDEEAKRQAENSASDVWISDVQTGDPRFYRIVQVPTEYGAYVAKNVYQFNLTAYIKHIISKGQ